MFSCFLGIWSTVCLGLIFMRALGLLSHLVQWGIARFHLWLYTLCFKRKYGRNKKTILWWTSFLHVQHINWGSLNTKLRGSAQTLFILWEMQKPMVRKPVIWPPQGHELLTCVVMSLHGKHKCGRCQIFHIHQEDSRIWMRLHLAVVAG